MARRESAKVTVEEPRARRIRIISVEGSIGAGKSRLMDALHEHIRAQGLSAITGENRVTSASRVRYLVVPEPIVSWTKQLYEIHPLSCESQERKSILKLFYGDMNVPYIR